MDRIAAPIAPPTPPSRTIDDAFTAAYREYRGMVRNVILGRLPTGSWHLADDLTQDTFFALFRYRERIDFGSPRLGGLLKVMARQSVGHYYRTKRNALEVPADTAHGWIANRNLSPAASGACELVRTGTTTRPGDSDPNPDEALRRVQGKPAPARSATCPRCGDWRTIPHPDGRGTIPCPACRPNAHNPTTSTLAGAR